MSSNYEYRPINELDGIRLLKLHPARGLSAPLHCSLIHQSLSVCDNRDIFGHYIALSYVWGCPDKIKTIFVDRMCLKITANLFSALYDLRDETRSLLLWADGICINQNDDGEKAMQIGIMGRIYAGAFHTIIYLGPAVPRSYESKSLDAIDAGEHQSVPHVDLLSDSVLKNPWFTRVWVFQELVYSTSPWVQIGTNRARWNIFYDKVPHKSQIIRDMHYARRLHQAGSNISQRDRETNSMLELLKARRGMGVSDPRDMVFAHVSFATDGQDEGLVIDYSKSYEQVYEECARWLAGKHGPEILFGCVCPVFGGVHSGSPKLPSWVPDWTWPSRANSTSATKQLPKESSITNFQMTSITFSATSLRDTILVTTPVLSTEHIPTDVKKEISREVSGFDILDETTVRGYKGLWKVWDQVRHIWSEVAQDPNFFSPGLRVLTRGTASRGGEGGGPLGDELAESVELHLIFGFDKPYINRMCLAKTASGRLGVVPSSCQPGDIIVSFGEMEKRKLSWMDFWTNMDKMHPISFVFRPLKFSNENGGADDDLPLSIDERSIPIDKGIASEEWSVAYCKFIGSCIFPISEEEIHNPSKVVTLVVY